MRKGFTLIELIIVIVILGVLAAIALPNLMDKGEEAKQKIVCVQMKNVSETLKMFRVDNGVYPTTDEGLEALISNPNPKKYTNYSSSGYIEDGKMPKDSWQSEFIYIAEKNGFKLLSLGADRKEGGEGTASDIDFKDCK